MYNDARKYDVDGVKVPLPHEIFNNLPTGLQNFKSPLHILSSSFLHLSKLLLSFSLWKVDRVDKKTPLWIYPISKQIVMRINMAIDLRELMSWPKPNNIFATSGDLSKTLMLLLPPSKPNNGCHIHVD